MFFFVFSLLSLGVWLFVLVFKGRRGRERMVVVF
jgi:cbb3-type cytochrome oxidase subunit 3